MDITIVINGELPGKRSTKELSQKLMGYFLRKTCVMEEMPERTISTTQA